MMTLLEELIVFAIERRMGGIGIGFAVPKGACSAWLEQAMAFELPRDGNVQICLFVVFDLEGEEEEMMRKQLDFPVSREEFGTHPFFDVIENRLVYYRITPGPLDFFCPPEWRKEYLNGYRAWLLATSGLKGKRGVPLMNFSRRRHLTGGWHRVARYETRVLFYPDERSAHQADAGHPGVAEEPEDA